MRGDMNRTLRRAQFPPDMPKPVADRVAIFERLRVEQREHDAHLAQLQQDRASAEHTHIAALAEALRAGTPEPDNGEVITDLDQRISAAEQRKKALAAALRDAFDDVCDAIDAHRESWTADLDRQEAKARKAYAEAVEQLALTRRAVSEILAVRAWLDPEYGFPQRPWYRVGDYVLRALIRPNGEPYGISGVLDALRADAAKPKPDKDSLVLADAQ
jgi:hypothetical protein